MNSFAEELKNLSHQELDSKVEELRRELFSLRLQAVTSPVKDHTQYKKLRRKIACALTIRKQKDK